VEAVFAGVEFISSRYPQLLTAEGLAMKAIGDVSDSSSAHAAMPPLQPVGEKRKFGCIAAVDEDETILEGEKPMCSPPPPPPSQLSKFAWNLWDAAFERDTSPLVSGTYCIRLKR
jgi:hypothetical protein